MENLQTVLEKILTLNINANTNIDIQGIVYQVVLYDTITKVSVALLTALTILAIAFMVYSSNRLSLEKKVDEELLKRMKETIQSFDEWRRLEELQKTVQEVLAYMPRNKKPRKS